MSEFEDSNLLEDESEMGSEFFDEFPLDTSRMLVDNEKSQVEEWKKYLSDTEETNQLIHSDNVLNLPEQYIIKSDCQLLIDALEIPNEFKQLVFFNLQVIITIYCKSEHKRYKTENGWLELLGVLIMKNSSRYETFNSFKRIKNNYVPEIGTHGFILRHLLLYHDPNLCSFFDKNNISIARSTELWANTLFSGVCSLPVVNSIWDYLLNYQDTFFIFFLFLVIIIEYRRELLEMESRNNHIIERTIEKLPYSINEGEVGDFLRLAESFDLKTPSFFKGKYYPYIFGKYRQPNMDFDALCLPVSAQEVMRNVFITSPVDTPKLLKFFIVDCRPLSEFSSGHLPVGLHIDCNSIFNPAHPDYIDALKKIQEPKESEDIPESMQPISKHICIMGFGSSNDECIQDIIKDLRKNEFPYISMISGGYQAVHEYFGENAHRYLMEHDKELCLVCKLQSVQESAHDVLSLMETDTSSSLSLSDRIKSDLVRRGKGAKDKLLRWAHSNSITHENLENEEFDKVSISEWLKKPKLIAFECKEIDQNNKRTYKSWFLISDTDIVLIRVSRKERKMGYLIVICPFTNIGKISLNRKNPDVITIGLDRSRVDVQAPYDNIKITIPGGNKVAAIIKQRISKKSK